MTLNRNGLIHKRFFQFALTIIAYALISATAAAQGDAARAGVRPEGKKQDASARNELSRHDGNLPLRFEPNVGQTDSRVKFLSRGRGYTLLLTGGEAVLSLRSQESEVWSQKEEKPPSSLLLGHLQRTKDNGQRTNDNGQGTNDIVRMRLVGAKQSAQATALDELRGKSNYFIGNDPTQWRTGVPNFARIKYHDIYPGVDLVYYGNQGKLEYDFVVSPGADPKAITLDVEAGDLKLENGKSKLETGNSKIEIAANGDLIVKTENGELRFHKPVVYQQKSGARSRESEERQRAKDDDQRTKDTLGRSEFSIPNSELLDGRYVLTADNRLHFEVSAYDKTRPLVIDPVLVYSTYLGGTGADTGLGIAVDASGNAYVAGTTTSTDFPVSGSPSQKTYAGNTGNCAFYTPCGDAFVTKLSADGTTILYSTYLGGSAGDAAMAIALDSSSNAYVTGSTTSTNFPVTPGVFQSTCGTGCFGNAFISKLSADGSSLVYSTYLGGSDQGASGNFSDVGTGIGVDASGNAYVTGQAHSTNFPVTAGAFQTTMPNSTQTAFVAKLNPTGTSLVYSTYLGGSAQAYAAAIGVDGGGNAYVTGLSFSADFPTTPGAFRIPFGTTANVVPSTTFVTKLSTDGSTLVYSASLGGTGGTSIVVDSSGSAYVTGGALKFFATTSTALGSGCDTGTFITKLTPDGSGIIYSSQFCAIAGNYTEALAVDSSGSAYLVGATDSTVFPATAGAFQTAIGNPCCFSDAFLTKLTPDGSAVMYSTYLGGELEEVGRALAVDSAGSAYLTGDTSSTMFPTATPLQAALAGAPDAFISKISPPSALFSLSPAVLDFGNQGVGFASTPKAVALANIGASALDVASISASGDFTESNNCGTSLAIGAHCYIQVSFNPSAAGALAGTLTVSAGGSSQTVQLAGTGASGPVVVLSPSTPQIINPAYPQFVNQPAGTTSPPLTVTVTNTGNAPLNVSSLSLTGSFTFGTDTCLSPVAPQASCTFELAYISSGSINGDSGDLTITDDASDSPQSIRLLGLGVPAGVDFLSLGLKFSDQPLGTTSAVQTVALMNGSGSQITLGSMTTTGDFAQTNNCAGNLANGAYCTFGVTFTPTAAGVRQGNIQVAFTGATGSPTILNLLGSSAGTPAAGLSTATLTFSDQIVGTTSAAQTVTFTNTGTGLLDIGSITLTGDFGQTSNCGSTLPAGAACTISVTFIPTATGTMTGTLAIADSATGSPQTVTLSGTGTAPVAGVSPTTLTFANQNVGTTSAAQAVTLSNSGTAALSVTSIAVSRDYAQTNNCGSSLAAGTNCTISVTFTPTATGTRTGTLTITDNASGSPQTVALTGTGMGPTVTLSASSLAFAGEFVSTASAAKSVTLTNGGNAALTITSIAAAGDFTETNTCGASLAAGANCSISVTFKPTAGGNRTGAITITDNAPGSPQTVALTGTGEDFSVAAGSGSSTSATVAPGGTANYNLSFSPGGGLTGTVTLACSGAPSESTCAASPASVTLNGSSAAASKVTVTTTAPTLVPPQGFFIHPRGGGDRPLQLWWLALLAALLALAALYERRRGSPVTNRRDGLARASGLAGLKAAATHWALATMLLLALLWAACGGGGSSVTHNPGTPAGTYNLTVTATYTSGSTTLTHTMALKLTVN